MNILSLESSCDETAAAVVKDGREVLSNVVASQINIHAKYGGVVPEVAARAHVQSIIPVVEKSLSETKISWKDIDAIAVTQGPGLVGSLIVGTETARTLAILKNKPFIAINHLEGHIYANFICSNPKSEIRNSKQVLNSNSQNSKPLNTKYSIRHTGEPTFPLVALLVSGGHTMLVYMPKHYEFKVVGSTLDDAAGEAFDKVAALIGLPYPGGPNISRLAERGNADKYKFPVIDLTPAPKRNSDGFLEYPEPSLDFSFSGLKTAVLSEVRKHKKLTDNAKSDIAASFQKTLVDTLVQNSQRAIAQYKPKSFILSGGVAANPLLRQKLAQLCEKLDISFHMPDLKYCTDNAAMIGAAAYHKQRKYGFSEPKELIPDPNLKLV